MQKFLSFLVLLGISSIASAALPTSRAFRMLQAPGYEGKVGGGYKGLLCTNVPGEQTLTTCRVDCINNHGALDGKCGDMSKGDYNCYCLGLSERGGGEESQHCRERTDDYRNICTLDCICEHASFGGHCEWEKKACICQGMGTNVQNKHCPAPGPKQFGSLIYNYLGGAITKEQLMFIEENARM